MTVATGRLARQLATWLPAVVLVPAAMVLGVQVSGPAAEDEELAALVPFTPGTTWVYAVYDHDRPSGTRTRQVVGETLVDVGDVDSVVVHSTYTDYPGSGAISDLLYLQRAEDRIDQTGLFVNHEHLAIDPPAPAYQLPIETGADWSYEGTVGTAQLRYDATVEAIEDVEVSGRTFTDCAHHVTVLRWQFAGQEEFGPENRFDEWTCPGFGPVRSIDVDEAAGTEVTEELVEFHGESGSWFAEAPDAAEADDTAPGSTSGFDAQHTNHVEGDLAADLAWSEERSARIDFPPASDGDAMVLAERDGEVSLTETGTGHVRWRVRLAGPVVAAPTIAGDRVLVADAEKRLWSLSLADGSTRWVRAFDDVVSSAPVARGTTVVVGTDDRRLTALDLTTGATTWAVRLLARLDTAPAIVDDRVVVADTSGRVAAYALADGDEQWQRDLAGSTLAGPLVAAGRVHVGDDTGVIYALDPADGEAAWEATSFYYPSEALAAGEDVLVVAADASRVEAYALADGTRTWTVPAEELNTAPVVVGDRVLTVDEDRVEVLDLADGSVVDQWPLPRPVDGERVRSITDPALVADTVVLHASHSAPGHNDTLLAYPVTADAARPGVSFRTEMREAPGFWFAPSVLAGERLFIPGGDGSLYRSDGPGEDSRPVLTSETGLPGVVVSDDVVLTHADGSLVALPVDGEEPLWSYESTTPFPGSLPAVGGDTVFVPLTQEGLAAVSLEDGSERWRIGIDLAVGSTTPLPLPGGDVVYGGGALGRYDGDTGRQRWSVLDGILAGPAAYADGLVFADVVPHLSQGAFTALDAATGEVVWRHPTDDHPLGLGPVVADGVVLFPDSRGRVTAYEAATGDELWQVAMSTPVAGQPVVIDGVAYVAETGRVDDLRQREYRIAAHDLRTGQYLGSFQPPSSALGPTLKLGGDEGGLTVPTSWTGTVVMIVRPR